MGMVATGPYINPTMGMLKTICIHLMIFLSVEAFIALIFIDNCCYGQNHLSYIPFLKRTTMVGTVV
jgi:hypothetical protein